MEKLRHCVIFGAGKYDSFPPFVPEGALVIAADAGLKKCEEYGISPDMVLGDFDSLGSVPDAGNVVLLPVEKDVTDTFAAVEAGQKAGCNSFFIYGGMGGRPDHSAANYALCASLSRDGIHCSLFGDGYEVTAVTNGKTELHGSVGDTVSVFSFTEKSIGVTYTGLKYSLNGAVLDCFFALGVSNEFSEEQATVEVKNGTLLVMRERKSR